MDESRADEPAGAAAPVLDNSTDTDDAAAAVPIDTNGANDAATTNGQPAGDDADEEQTATAEATATAADGVEEDEAAAAASGDEETGDDGSADDTAVDATAADVTADGDADQTAEQSPAKEGAVAAAPVQEVDLDQCRVCLSKADLVNIFSLGEGNMRICDIVMTVCRVKILERDHLPNFLCMPCVDKVNAAMTFKTACETTDQDLRSKLKRSKKTVRRSRGDFILVDCRLSSSDNEALPSKTRGNKSRNDDDDEFKISDGEADEASVADSSDSNYSEKANVSVSKRGRGRPRGRPLGRPPKAKSAKVEMVKRTPIGASKRGRKSKNTAEIMHDVVYLDAAPAISDESSSDDDDPVVQAPPPKRRGRPPKALSSSTPLAAKPKSEAVSSSSKSATNNSGGTPTSRIPHKKRALRNDDDSDEEYRVKEKKSPGSSRKGHPCPFCDEVFATFERLKEHKKKYIGQKPLVCKVCGKAFKNRIFFDLHVAKHNEAPTSLKCKVCSKECKSTVDLQRHEQTEHKKTYTCGKCKRPFQSQPRLERHVKYKCPGVEGQESKPLKRKSETSAEATGGSGGGGGTVVPIGRDLFKCVAPLTTTYWSDSFSD